MEISPVTLMVIGMITVFVVLVLVVLSGNLLIALVNKYIPEEEPKPLRSVASESSTALESNKISAIVAAVDWLTKGKGKITKIEKNK